MPLQAGRQQMGSAPKCGPPVDMHLDCHAIYNEY